MFRKNFKIKYKTSPFVVLLTIVGIMISGNLSAHETRIAADGALKMVVGNNPEPVFEDEVGHTDLFLSVQDEDGEYTIPVNTNDGADIEHLELYVLLLRNDEYIANELELEDMVIKKMKLDGLSLRFGTENRYGTPIRYTHDGAIGFHYTGHIHVNGNDIDINEIFVCGNGHSPDVTHGFGCVSDAPTFPGDRRNRGRDKNSYKDNDRYSLNQDD